MHESTRVRLEELLAARGAAAEQHGVDTHLSSCSECSAELTVMKSQSELLQVLRPSEDVEPAPGFYARVLQRIEERAKESIWALFVDSPFSKRLAYGSLALALMLGTYVVTSEVLDGHFGSGSMQIVHQDPLVVGSQAQQRDAVLENFAAHPVLANYTSQ